MFILIIEKAFCYILSDDFNLRANIKIYFKQTYKKVSLKYYDV